MTSFETAKILQRKWGIVTKIKAIERESCQKIFVQISFLFYKTLKYYVKIQVQKGIFWLNKENWEGYLLEYSYKLIYNYRISLFSKNEFPENLDVSSFPFFLFLGEKLFVSMKIEYYKRIKS